MRGTLIVILLVAMQNNRLQNALSTPVFHLVYRLKSFQTIIEIIHMTNEGFYIYKPSIYHTNCLFETVCSVSPSSYYRQPMNSN